VSGVFSAFLLFLLQLPLLGYLASKLQQLEIEIFGFKLGVWFSAPGTVLHELSHYLACRLTGTKVTKLVLFSPGETAKGSGRYTLGCVGYRNPNFLGGLLIAPAPFFGVSLIFFWLTGLLFPGKSPAGGYLEILRAYFSRLDFHSLKTYLLIYLALAVLPGAAPSREDFKNYRPILLFFLASALGLSLWFALGGAQPAGLWFKGFLRLSALVNASLSFSLAGCILAVLALGFLKFLKSRLPG